MNTSNTIPCAKTLDSTMRMLNEGYPFIQNRCKKYKSHIFQTRLLGQKAICISGKEAAKLFYNENLFKRKGVAPKRVQNTLLGKRGVQGLDGEAHKIRKEMFISIMAPERIECLIQILNEQWDKSSTDWIDNQIVLFDEAQKVLCRAACKWAGIPLKENELVDRAADLGKMIDGFGAIGPRYWQGCTARTNSEKWIRYIISQIRSHKIIPKEDTAAFIIAWHRNENGKLLNNHVAAVELLNIIRPITAIATYISFGALAMHKNPKCRRKFQLNNDSYQQMFIQEIRRLYPFTPFLGAKVKKDFTWKQHHFIKGTLVLLDVYGTDHDPSIWEQPYKFNPDRFNYTLDQSYEFIPQGGGDYHTGHRCAGEQLTIEVMKTSLNFIANQLDYMVPKQNLKVKLCRIPTLPKSRFIMSHVTRRFAVS